MSSDASGETARLARRLTTADAVTIGLGAMIGAGVFAAVGPAAAAAGSWLLLGLALAGVVAYCNATSSAQLASLYPESGGTYVYGRVRLAPFWGYLAGWSFVVGKTASLAAMALTFGFYVQPEGGRPLGVAAGTPRTARVVSRRRRWPLDVPWVCPRRPSARRSVELTGAAALLV
jgi:basic amino acid/polyamine antiporter, APA family